MIIQNTQILALQNYSKIQNLPKKPGQKPMNLPGGTDFRFDGLHHYVQTTANDSKRRCARELYKSKGRTECSKCNVRLCVRCLKLTIQNNFPNKFLMKYSVLLLFSNNL